MGEMRIVNSDGDQKTIWNPDNKAEVKVARNTFDSLKKEGYIAYSVEKDGKPGKILDKFNPDLGAIIMTPPLVGG